MSILSADLPCSTLIFVQNIFEKFQEMWTTVNQIKSKRNLEIYIKTIEKKYIIPLLQTDEKNIKADPEKLSVFLTEVLLNRNSKVDLYFSAALSGTMNSMSNEALIKRLRKEVEIHYTQIKKFCIELETGLDVSLYKGRIVLAEEHLSRLKNYLPEEKYSWTN